MTKINIFIFSIFSSLMILNTGYSQNFINSYKLFKNPDHLKDTLHDDLFINSKSSILNTDLFIDSMIIIRVNKIKIKYEYTYNNYDQISEVKIYNTVNNKYVTQWLIKNIYNSSNKLVSAITKQYVDNNTLLNYSRTDYFFYSKLNREIEIRQYWNGNQWENSARNTYQYDAHKNIISFLLEEWVNDEWLNVYHQLYSYLNDEYVSSTMVQEWEDMSWVNKYRGFHEYINQNGLKINLSIGEIWNANQWVNFTKRIYEYDEFGNNVRKKNFIWTENGWSDYDRISISYNEENYFDYGKYELWKDNESIPYNGMIFVKIPNGILLGEYGHEIFIYYDFLTGIDENNGLITNYDLFQKFPNPFNPVTHLKYSLKEDGFVSIKVYDILGNEITTLVNEQKAKGIYTTEFNAANLPSGVYIYTIQVNDFSAAKKMILTK